MQTSEVSKLCVDPIWFICNEDVIVNVFHELNLHSTVHVCD